MNLTIISNITFLRVFIMPLAASLWRHDATTWFYSAASAWEGGGGVGKGLWEGGWGLSEEGKGGGPVVLARRGEG